MPTKKPRINVTLETNEYALLKRYAELQGVSMSKVISGFIELTIEPLERFCVMLEGIKHTDKEIHQGFRQSIDQATDDVGMVFQKHITQNDLFFSTSNSATNSTSRLVTTGDRPPLDPHSTVK